MSSDIFTVKIERMKQTDIDSIIAIEEKAYGEHHWSRESFFNELSNELARYYSAFDEMANLSVMQEAGRFWKKLILQILLLLLSFADAI